MATLSRGRESPWCWCPLVPGGGSRSQHFIVFLWKLGHAISRDYAWGSGSIVLGGVHLVRVNINVAQDFTVLMPCHPGLNCKHIKS